MKELSIEEKAKAYDEALEMAKKLIENEETNVPVFYVNNIKDIFPELKESEGERIRKELIDFVKSRLAGFPDCKRFTDWLEKQKHGEVAIEGQVRDHNFIDFDSSGTSFMIPVPNHNLKCGDKVLVKILKLE